MDRLSFMDKLSVLLEITKSSSLYIVILIAILALGLILLSTNKNETVVKYTLPEDNKTIFSLLFSHMS